MTTYLHYTIMSQIPVLPGIQVAADKPLPTVIDPMAEKIAWLSFQYPVPFSS